MQHWIAKVAAETFLARYEGQYLREWKLMDKSSTTTTIFRLQTLQRDKTLGVCFPLQMSSQRDPPYWGMKTGTPHGRQRIRSLWCHPHLIERGRAQQLISDFPQRLNGLELCNIERHTRGGDESSTVAL